MMTPKKRPFWRSRLFWMEALFYVALFFACLTAMAIGRATGTGTFPW